MEIGIWLVIVSAYVDPVFVCFGLTYEICSGGGPFMYIYFGLQFVQPEGLGGGVYLYIYMLLI